MADPKSGPVGKDYFSRTEEETVALGATLSKNFRGDEVVLLSGGLGSGKTVFTKGIAAGLDVEDVHLVRSPSYTLINIYQARCPIYHIDLYRLETQKDIDRLGWEDYLGEGIIVFEWAEKMEFSGDAIRAVFQIAGTSERKIRLSTGTPILAALFP